MGFPASDQSPTARRPTPGPAGVVSFDAYVDPLAFLRDLVRDYGDVVRYATSFGPCFLFTRPDHVQTILHSENFRRASLVKMMLGDGLLASDGPRWRSQRKLMQKDFLPDRITPFATIVTRQTSQMETAWNAAAAANEEIDVTTAMTRLTLRIIVAALFSDDLSEDHATRLCAAVTQTINDLGRISKSIFGVPVQFTPQSNAAFASGKRVIDATCHEMISRRRAQPAANRPADLLSLLLGAETDNGPLTDLQLRDEMVTMLVGGHETTALALSWAWKALAEHPEAEARLHRETSDVLANRTPELADLPKLLWARAAFQEAMRLYPPVWYMGKVAGEPDEIGGHAIPRGACVLISPWFTHRHEAFWPAPEEFRPQRFLEPSAAAMHRYAYFPFAGGRHQCLGMHLALLEGTLILAQLARSFRIEPIAGQQIRPDPGITLRQSPLMRARVTRRNVLAMEAVS